MMQILPTECARAFTLIELLIVVAIIAILAAIALPNFLEAQTRAKVARVRSDLRTLSMAIESYTVDFNRPPYDGEPGEAHWGWVNSQIQMTTPVAYITRVFADVFQDDSVHEYTDALPGHTFYVDHPSDTDHSYDYATAHWHSVESVEWIRELWTSRMGHSAWKIGSCGPDQTFLTSWIGWGLDERYDPTNGTVSNGDIYRSQARLD